MNADATEHAPVVTIAALYGAGGSVIGPRVAERLRVPFLDRAIPEAVATGAGLPEEAVAGADEKPRPLRERLTEGLGRISTVTGRGGGGVERLDVQESRLRGYIEEFLAEASVSGGVAMGRGGNVILRTVGWALHVFLGGPFEGRIAQGVAREGIDRAAAEARQKAEDGARIAYVRRNYGVDGTDPAFYHLMLDSTALAIDTCVELIVTAAQARVREPRPSPPI
jgi:hypothetical protein